MNITFQIRYLHDVDKWDLTYFCYGQAVQKKEFSAAQPLREFLKTEIGKIDKTANNRLSIPVFNS